MAKQITGIVTSSKADKTIVVTVHTRKTHPLYKKQYSVTSKFMAHDPKNEAQNGDKVVIEETKPISARKRFVLTTIVEKPALREDNLKITKVEEPARPATKKKSDFEDSEEE